MKKFKVIHLEGTIEAENLEEARIKFYFMLQIYKAYDVLEEFFDVEEVEQ